MKLLLAVSTCSLLLLAASARCAEWPKQRFVEIQNAPDTELCRSVTEAVAVMRKDWSQLYGKFRNPGPSSPSDLQVMGLSFHALQLKTFTTVDRKGVNRTYDRNYYRVDIDNTPPVEMITFSSGGYGAAGEGDTLFVLRNDISSASQPVANEEFANIAFEIGTRSIAFSGKDFDHNYYIYPFAFQGRNYLLIEGNRDRYRKDLVAELVPGTGIVTRCYF